MRKLLLLGAERVDDKGLDRIWAAFRDGDPDGEVHRSRVRPRAPATRQDATAIAQRSGRGFRNVTNYRLRILLAGGLLRERQTVTGLRARPSPVA